MMKRFLATSLIIGASAVGLVGCEQKTEDKTVEKVTTPKGTVTETKSDKVEKTGDLKDKEPAPSSTTTTTTETPK